MSVSFAPPDLKFSSVTIRKHTNNPKRQHKDPIEYSVYVSNNGQPNEVYYNESNYDGLNSIELIAKDTNAKECTDILNLFITNTLIKLNVDSKAILARNLKQNEEAPLIDGLWHVAKEECKVAKDNVKAHLVKLATTLKETNEAASNSIVEALRGFTEAHELYEDSVKTGVLKKYARDGYTFGISDYPYSANEMHFYKSPLPTMKTLPILKKINT